jgi:hypothetical protein
MKVPSDVILVAPYIFAYTPGTTLVPVPLPGSGALSFLQPEFISMMKAVIDTEKIDFRFIN